MGRRAFILVLAGWALWPGIASVVLGPIGALAQAPPKRPVIVLLSAAPQAGFLYYKNAFLQGLHELGYAEGRDMNVIERYADGFLDRLPALAEEVVHLNPSAILAQTSSVALAASRATTTIPIVVATMADRLNLVGNDARPTGNVTGVLVNLEGLAGKQLQIAQELIPGSKKVGLLFNAGNPGIAFQRREFADAAAAMGFKLVTADVRTPRRSRCRASAARRRACRDRHDRAGCAVDRLPESNRWFGCGSPAAVHGRVPHLCRGGRGDHLWNQSKR